MIESQHTDKQADIECRNNQSYDPEHNFKNRRIGVLTHDFFGGSKIDLCEDRNG